VVQSYSRFNALLIPADNLRPFGPSWSAFWTTQKRTLETTVTQNISIQKLATLVQGVETVCQEKKTQMTVFNLKYEFAFKYAMK